MKEVQAIIGIILIVIGDIIFEIQGETLIKFCGLLMVAIGIIIYLFVVESFDKKEKKEIKKKDLSPFSFPLK